MSGTIEASPAAATARTDGVRRIAACVSAAAASGSTISTTNAVTNGPASTTASVAGPASRTS